MREVCCDGACRVEKNPDETRGSQAAPGVLPAQGADSENQQGHGENEVDDEDAVEPDPEIRKRLKYHGTEGCDAVEPDMEEHACRAENPGPNERKGVIRPSAPERPEGESQDQGKKGQRGQGMRDAPVQGQKKFRRAAEEGIDVRGGCGEAGQGNSPGRGRTLRQSKHEERPGSGMCDRIHGGYCLKGELCRGVVRREFSSSPRGATRLWL